MSLTLDYSNVMDVNLGTEQGLSISEIEALLEKGQQVFQELKQKAENEELGFYQLPFKEDVFVEITTFANAARKRFDYYVHLGIGGSALGPIAIHSALRDSFYNLSEKPKIFFPDNVDPDWIHDIVKHIEVNRTLFHVVSKSGATAETAASLLYFMRYLKEQLGDNFYKNLIFTTDPVEGLLNVIAREYPIKCFRIPPNVGGRFSVLTPVGLIPAAIVGVDIQALVQGAAKMAKRCNEEDLLKNPAFIFAAIHYLYMKRGKNISVMMPYSNKLRDLADWYRQLWAESLGKRFDIHGNVVEVGQTPVKALGATDQHSQVQLYVEGPNDKVITFLEVEKFENNEPLHNYFSQISEFDYFEGKSLGQLLNYEKQATELALTNNQRPNLTIKFPEVSAENVGAFFFLLEAATAFAGGLLEINAFDQPGVEQGKVATYALMGRKGYEKKRKEILEQLEKKKLFVV